MKSILVNYYPWAYPGPQQIYKMEGFATIIYGKKLSLTITAKFFILDVCGGPDFTRVIGKHCEKYCNFT